MKVLVACEESQRVTIAFRELGHLAFSCDLKDCSGGFPEWHIKGDCIEVIEHNSWDLIIAHPPCQCLCRLDTMNYSKFGEAWSFERQKKRELARDFFMYFYNFVGCRIAIENPVPAKASNLPPYSQIIQPFQFGENYSKQTCLWLKDLPLLMPDCYAVSKRKFGESWCAVHRDATQRSKTFNGIAKAMARQWGNL